MERPRDSSDFISRTRSLLEEIDNVSDEEDLFEDNQVYTYILYFRKNTRTRTNTYSCFFY